MAANIAPVSNTKLEQRAGLPNRTKSVVLGWNNQILGHVQRRFIGLLLVRRSPLLEPDESPMLEPEPKKPKQKTDGFKHGASGYTHHGCRCEICKVGAAEYRRKRIIALRARGPSTFKHGASGYTNHSCRCEICVEAIREYRRKRGEHKPQRRFADDS